MLVEMANAYCDALNAGSIPTIESAWDYVRQEEVTKGVKMAIESEEVRSQLLSISNQQVPLTSQHLDQLKDAVKSTALDIFESSGCAMLEDSDPQ